MSLTASFVSYSIIIYIEMEKEEEEENDGEIVSLSNSRIECLRVF